MIPDYHHLPICAIMLLFFGISLSRPSAPEAAWRKVASMIASALEPCLPYRTHKAGNDRREIISYWLGNRSIAGGYAIGIAIEVDALSLFFGCSSVSRPLPPAFTAWTIYPGDAHQVQYYTLLLMTSAAFSAWC